MKIPSIAVVSSTYAEFASFVLNDAESKGLGDFKRKIVGGTVKILKDPPLYYIHFNDIMDVGMELDLHFSEIHLTGNKITNEMRDVFWELAKRNPEAYRGRDP